MLTKINQYCEMKKCFTILALYIFILACASATVFAQSDSKQDQQKIEEEFKPKIQKALNDLNMYYSGYGYRADQFRITNGYLIKYYGKIDSAYAKISDIDKAYVETYYNSTDVYIRCNNKDTCYNGALMGRLSDCLSISREDKAKVPEKLAGLINQLLLEYKAYDLACYNYLKQITEKEPVKYEEYYFGNRFYTFNFSGDVHKTNKPKDEQTALKILNDYMRKYDTAYRDIEIKDEMVYFYCLNKGNYLPIYFGLDELKKNIIPYTLPDGKTVRLYCKNYTKCIQGGDNVSGYFNYWLKSGNSEMDSELIKRFVQDLIDVL